MATITASTYLDGGTARTAGETWTINSGAVLTVRTDTRVHANAPASLTGTLGNVTVNEGEIFVDARNIRWLPFDTGTGNVPAIGTTVTQGAVSGYLLGVWASYTAAPTAAGAAMPTSGFIKFREVTGGTFSTGALTGIGASATDLDVLGWLEFAFDLGSDITLGRLGKHTIRGGRFYLGETTGVSGQTIQCPSSGSANVRFPGLYIENEPDSGNTDDDYTMHMGINGSGTGWSSASIGGPYGATDRRQCYVKQLNDGVMQIGEDVDQSATYATRSALSGNYTTLYIDCTYTWAGNYVYISTNGTDSHQLDAGTKSLGFLFTSGGAVGNDGLFTATIQSAYHMRIPLTGSGASGNVRVYLGVRVYGLASTHYFQAGENIRATVSTGTLPTGTYAIRTNYSSTEIVIEYPHYSAVSGQATWFNSLLVTFTAHGLVVGKQVYMDFTSGDGVDGVYTVKAVASSSQYYVYMDHNTSTSGNVTVKQTIGYVPPAGCRIWIPNVFFAEANAASRGTNTFVYGTALADRTSWVTTSAGNIDFDYVTFLGCYINFTSSYAAYLRRCLVLDMVNIASIVSEFELEYVGAVNANYGNPVLTITSVKSRGLLKDCRFECGNATKGYLSKAAYITYCNNIEIDNVYINSFCPTAGRQTTATSLYVEWGSNYDFKDLFVGGGYLWLDSASDMTIDGLDYTDLHSGLQGGVNGVSALSMNYLCQNVVIDGVTIGLLGTIPGTQPYNGLFSISSSDDVTVRNIGTEANPIDLSGGVVGYPGYGTERISSIAKDCVDTRFQRVFVNGLRTNYITPASLARWVTFENVDMGWYITTLTSKTPTQLYNYGSDSSIKGIGVSKIYGTALASVYGTHFVDIFLSDAYGQLTLLMNEPTATTSPYFTLVSGTAKFNGSGGCVLPTTDCVSIWEDRYFRKGHTGFQNVTPVMAGGTFGNYDLDYQIDIGSGYSAWTDLTAANLSAITVDPAIGFKMKLRITTTSANTDAITFVHIFTTTTDAAQDNFYPLDVCTITISNMATGSIIQATEVTGGALVYAGAGLSFTVESTNALRVEVRCASSTPFYKPWVTQLTPISGETITAVALQELDE